MKSLRVPIAVAALLALVSAASVDAADKIQFKLNLDAGKVYRLDMTMDQAIEQSFQGNAMSIQQTIGLGTAVEVKSVEPDGSIKTRFVYDWATMKQQGPGGAIDFDSRKGQQAAGNPATAVYGALVGSSFNVTLTPDGSASEVSGFDEMMEKLLDSMNLPQGAMRDQISGQLRGQFGDEAIQRNMQQAIVFPDHPVGVGDSWTHDLDMQLGYPMSIHSEYTLKSRSGGRSIVSVRSTISPPADNKPVQQGPMTMLVEMEGDQVGETVIDEATGWVVSSDLTQDIGGKMTMTIPGQGETVVPMKINSTIKIGSE